ncbi:isocitrate lyase/phosphoenolpyruvate mutase family protein [Parvibaculum sp.]|uniref:isocitrate lyase/phosphoenolpyruvate mutase family protein n=1 Tax=Parvibaculum sp. TaxID=2024848 RepID=UPI0034A034F5
MTTPTQAEKAASFAKLHTAGCFALANVWDMPSAALVAEAGAAALATSSAAVAFVHGLPDGEKISRDLMLAVAGNIARRMPLPVSADLEAGYGPAPEDVAETVRLAIEAGLVGCNIEDRDPRTGKLFAFDDAVARIRAGTEAAKTAGLPDFTLNARTDPYLIGFGTAEENFAEAVKRANAYLGAGAGAAFVPGPADAKTIGALVAAIGGPLNVMALPKTPPLAELARLGVRRLSLGSGLMNATYGYTRRMLEELKEKGEFGFIGEGVSFMEFMQLLGKYR